MAQSYSNALQVKLNPTPLSNAPFQVGPTYRGSTSGSTSPIINQATIPGYSGTPTAPPTQKQVAPTAPMAPTAPAPQAPVTGSITNEAQASAAGWAANPNNPTNQTPPQPTVPPVQAQNTNTVSPYQNGNDLVASGYGGLLGNLLNTSREGAQNVINTGNLGANNIQAAGQPSPKYQAAWNVYQNLTNGLNAGQNQIMNKPIPLQFQQGQEAALQRDYGTQLTAASNALQQAAQEQGYGLTGATAAGQLATGAAENAGQLGTTGATSAAQGAAPQSYGLTTQPYFPANDTYGGGGSGGAINRSVQAANIGSAQDFQNKINTTQATAGAANADLNILNGYAKGFGSDVPILNGLTQLYGNTLQGNQAVAAFRAKLQDVRNEYQQITGGDGTAAIPDNVTANQLAAIQSSLSSTAQNSVTGYKNQLGQLQNGGASAGSANDPLGIFQ